MLNMTIDGKPAETLDTFDVVNPATGLVEAQAPECTQEQLDAIDDIGLNGWLSIKLFAEVAAGHEITDGASVIDAFAAIDEPISLGEAYPHYLGIQDPPPHPDYPRVASFEVGTSVVKGGKIIPDGDFFDPFAAS